MCETVLKFLFTVQTDLTIFGDVAVYHVPALDGLLLCFSVLCVAAFVRSSKLLLICIFFTRPVTHAFIGLDELGIMHAKQVRNKLSH